MRLSWRRLRNVALVSFFPLAIIGLVKEKKSPALALKLYYSSVMIFAIFMIFLAIYTYSRGGKFIAPLGTFY